MSRSNRNILLDYDEDELVRELATYVDRNDPSASPHVYAKLGKYLAFPNVVQRGIDQIAFKWMLEQFIKLHQGDEEMVKLLSKAHVLQTRYFPKAEPDWTKAQAKASLNKGR